MHHCEEFRERITEYIIDREDLAGKAELQRELLTCSDCSEFYAESREMMDALSEIDLTISESQWNGIEQRLQAQIRNAPQNAPRLQLQPRTPVAAVRAAARVRRVDAPFYTRMPVWGSAVALLFVAIALSRIVGQVEEPQVSKDTAPAVYVEHSVPLDPVTLDFLEESELLLRNVMKMAPTDVEDLADARKVASEQLAELSQRKQAAAEVPPVVGVMETYETVLRDLRNVDDQNADEDIGDIKRRIQSNGLIANMKAFQPRVTEISFGLR
jgi:hypothetical protein